MSLRTEDEAMADPATTADVRLRITADRFGRALFNGLRRHHERLGWDPPPPPQWEELPPYERANYWRAAIYDMLEAMCDA